MEDDIFEEDTLILKSERRSVGREMQSLIKSAKDSKIIKEFTEIPNQKRRSRRDLTKTPKKRRRTSIKEHFKKQKDNKEKRSLSVSRMSTEVGLKPDKESFCLPAQTSSVDISKRRSSCPEISFDDDSKNVNINIFLNCYFLGEYNVKYNMKYFSTDIL